MKSIWPRVMIQASFVALTFFALSRVWAAEILLDDYRGGLSPQWKMKIFSGMTQYETTRKDGRWCIRATSHASASALYYKIRYDPKIYPFLSWSWKADRIISKGNALKKEGDDYAARLYVVFDSPWFWDTQALNYIWANSLPIGQAIPNAFTSHAIMIAVESGATHCGQWREYRRNVLEDYQKYFRKEVSDVVSIAIMTDTDNTGEEAKAWYGPIKVYSD